MEVCLAQLASVIDDPDASLQKADDAVSEAVCRGADLIVFPEQFATGWDPGSIRHAEGDDGPIISGWRRIAEEYGAWIAGSHREVSDGGVRNTTLLIDPDGTLKGRYAKIHLFTPGGEGEQYTAGDTFVICDVAGIRVGCAICYDLRFPELFRRYADRGAECMIVPAAWPCSRLDHFHLFARARAVENQFYLAAVCATGRTPVDTYCGGSCIVDPTGEVISRAGDGEALISAPISSDQIQQVREAFPMQRDLRRDIYMDRTSYNRE